MNEGADHADGSMRPGPTALVAKVVASLPNAMFRLRLADGRELLAHVAGSMRMAFTRLLPGDEVIVEVSPFDPTKARIARLVDGRSAAPESRNQPNSSTRISPLEREQP